MAASLTFSSLFSSTATATGPIPVSSRLVRPRTISSAFSSKFSHTPFDIKFHDRNNPKSLRFSSTSSSRFAVSATISLGDKLPESILSYLDADDQVQTITVSDLTKGKKAILFAVPGAFTPTCSQKHVPDFVERSAELMAKGVDTIACISVNDAFVMKAWKENLKVNDEVLLLSDGNGDFTRAIGVELDLSDKPVGLGVRSRRYALLAEDGVVKELNLEEGGAFTFSGAEDMLKLL